MDSDLRTAIIAGVSAIIGGSLAVSYAVGQRELDIKMMEIAIGLLKENPDGPLQPAREWAVDVIDHYSTDVPLNQPARAALKEHPVDVFRLRFRALGSGPIGRGAIGGGTLGGGTLGGIDDPPQKGNGQP